MLVLGAKLQPDSTKCKITVIDNLILISTNVTTAANIFQFSIKVKTPSAGPVINNQLTGPFKSKLLVCYRQPDCHSRELEKLSWVLVMCGAQEYLVIHLYAE